jgi:hypothetical protein
VPDEKEKETPKSVSHINSDDSEYNGFEPKMKKAKLVRKKTIVDNQMAYDINEI